MWSAEDRGSFSEVLMVSFVFFLSLAVVVICWNAETVVMRMAARRNEVTFMVEGQINVDGKSIFLPTHLA